MTRRRIGISQERLDKALSDLDSEYRVDYLKKALLASAKVASVNTEELILTELVNTVTKSYQKQIARSINLEKNNIYENRIDLASFLGEHGYEKHALNCLDSVINDAKSLNHRIQNTYVNKNSYFYWITRSGGAQDADWDQWCEDKEGYRRAIVANQKYRSQSAKEFGSLFRLLTEKKEALIQTEGHDCGLELVNYEMR